MTSRQPLLLILALLCFTAFSAAPSRAQETDAAAPQVATPAPPAAGGLLLGVAWVDRPDVTQLDSTRNIRVYSWLLNNTPAPMVIDWRTRRLISSKVSCSISDPDPYAQFVIAPGEICLMKSFFYYKTGFPGKFTFSVRDQEQRIYSVAATPMATNIGHFSVLPPGIQQRLIETFLQAQPNFYKWWYRDY